MNILKKSPSLDLSTASFLDLRPARRLIVLVPDFEMNTGAAARKIWELANALESGVQFLGLSRDAAREPGLRRGIATLSAMVGDGCTPVESKIEIGNNWLKLVESNWQDGDVIVCFRDNQPGLARKSLNQILESKLNATIHVFTGLQQEKPERSNWAGNTISWAGSIGIILAFAWLQSCFIANGANSALFYISILAELGSLWVWVSVFG